MIVLDGTSGITSPAETVTGQFSSGSTFANKNRIINGGMVIDQRNAGASVTPTIGGYCLDRWYQDRTVASKFSIQQNAGAITPPVGFSNYLGITSLSAYSVLTGDTFLFDQKIEGFNTADLAWGTVNAQAVTLSFRVYSSLTGTFGGALTNSAVNRSYPFSYSIPVANTWTTISVTIAGDATGTWIGATNGIGVEVRFGLGSGATYSGTAGSWQAGNIVQPTGSVSVVGTSGATFYITGVQLEKGSVATSFDYRPYGTEFALCQRYTFIPCNKVVNQALGFGQAISTTSAQIYVRFPVEMRTAPSLSWSSGATDFLALTPTGTSAGFVTTLVIGPSSSNGCRVDTTLASGLTSSTATAIQVANVGVSQIILSAEL